MDVKLNNTLTGKKEIFEPIEPGKVSMYHCGPTVYSFAHIGNMRAYVFADILRRTFEYFGYDIKQVVNITDVGHLTSDQDDGEDKVETAARKEGKTAGEISRFYEDAFYRDLADLNVDIGGTEFPRATEHIKEQIEIVKILEEKGFAYKTSDGLYFDTSKFKDYGKLGNIKITDQKEGARVEANKEKKNPSDFALWKFSNPEKEGERLQEWKSPWGTGFPGWHIECSAMSRKYLGQPFDIHTGGIDHIGIHHNNEIAQSEAAYGVPLANYWLHNEFITVEGEKMSKSLGNVFTISDLRERKIHPLAFRYLLLSGRYSSPMNFTWDAALGAQKALENIASKYLDLPESADSDEPVKKEFEEAISDDLNTPIALALLQKAQSKNMMDTMDKVLGLNVKKLSEEMKKVPSEILELKKERDTARTQKNFQKSDELRKEIERKGYIVEDKNNETRIRRSLASLV